VTQRDNRHCTKQYSFTRGQSGHARSGSTPCVIGPVFHYTRRVPTGTPTISVPEQVHEPLRVDVKTTRGIRTGAIVERRRGPLWRCHFGPSPGATDTQESLVANGMRYTCMLTPIGSARIRGRKGA
jgi:hypothetical protein